MLTAQLGDNVLFHCRLEATVCFLQVEVTGENPAVFTSASPNQNLAIAWALAKAWGIHPPDVQSPVFSRCQDASYMVSLVVGGKEYVGSARLSESEKLQALVNAFMEIRPLNTSRLIAA